MLAAMGVRNDPNLDRAQVEPLISTPLGALAYRGLRSTDNFG
jgi:hypothetical protein